MCLIYLEKCEVDTFRAYKLFSIDEKGRLAPAFAIQIDEFRYEMDKTLVHPHFDQDTGNGYFAFPKRVGAEIILKEHGDWALTRTWDFCILPVALTGEIYTGHLDKYSFITTPMGVMSSEIYIPKAKIEVIPNPWKKRREWRRHIMMKQV